MSENRLATLDIFSGCGGLSEGLEQSGEFNYTSITRNNIYSICNI